MSKKREYDEEYKVQAIELAKNLSGNPMESRKLTGKHTNLMIFWNVISQQMHRCKSVWQILQKFRQKTENCMFQQFLTAMTYCQWVCQWRIICVRNCAVKCWNMRICEMWKHLGKDERRIVLSPGQKDRTLQNGRTEIHGLAVFHELLEQPQDLLIHWRASSCCKAAKILRSGCRRTLRFIILVGNVSSVIDNFKMSHCT